MRAFIGIEVTDELRAALTDAQKKLARCPARVKWVHPENVHLTLKFLGDVDEPTVGRVKAAMADTAGGGPFAFAVQGLGIFPPRGTPRVIWAGVSDGADAATKLQARLEDALRPIGFGNERSFVPHLTIGRVKDPKGARELTAMVERDANKRFGLCTAAEMVLFESTLTPQGAIYTAVVRQAL